MNDDAAKHAMPHAGDQPAHAILRLRGLWQGGVMVQAAGLFLAARGG